MDHVKFIAKDDDPYRDFYPVLKQRVQDFMSEARLTHGPTAEFWLKALVWLVLTYGLYCFILFGGVSGFPLLFLAVVCSLSGLIFGFNVGHDASHRAITGKGWIDELLHIISFATVGIDPMLWRLRHVRSHHQFANVNGSDQDIDKNPFLRLSPEHPWHRKYKYQAFYAPFVYSLALLHSVFWGDWVYMLSKDYEWMRKGVSPLKLWSCFIFCKITHFSFHIFIPMAVMSVPLWQILLAYLVGSAFISLVFVAVLVGTHFFDEAEFPVADNEGKLKHNWAIHQLVTSCDWNPEGFWPSFFFGGSNNHACHHLFPRMCHVHYRKITPIIDSTIREYGLPYHSLSLPQMLRSHFRFLHKMGQTNV